MPGGGGSGLMMKGEKKLKSCCRNYFDSFERGSRKSRKSQPAQLSVHSSFLIGYKYPGCVVEVGITGIPILPSTSYQRVGTLGGSRG